MITIDELMTTEPYTLRETDTLADAWKIMTDKHIRHIPIIDQDANLLGLVTQRDVLAATQPFSMHDGKNALDESGSDIELSSIMIKNIKVLHENDSVRQAAIYMQSHKYGCLPVVLKEKLVGIITDSDFIAVAINLIEQIELMEDEPVDDLDLQEISV